MNKRRPETALDQWRALLRDVEAATGPTAELEESARRLDAVVTLVEREMPNALIALEFHRSYSKARIDRHYEGFRADAKIALALLAAFIRARIEMEQTKGVG